MALKSQREVVEVEAAPVAVAKDNLAASRAVAGLNAPASESSRSD